jgi:hypothetical protein
MTNNKENSMSGDNGTKVTRRPIHAASADTVALANLLATQEPGDFIPYSRLSEEIGKPVEGATPALRSARERALNQHGLVFDVVMGEGLLCLDDEGISKLGEAQVKGIGRKARKAKKQVSKIRNFDKLPADAKHRAAAIYSYLGVIDRTSRKPAQEKLMQVVERRQVTHGGKLDELPTAKALEAMK